LEVAKDFKATMNLAELFRDIAVGIIHNALFFLVFLNSCRKIIL